MYRTLIVLAAAMLAAGPVAASEKTEVMAVVHQWIDGFNKGDTKSSLAMCADQVSIIDEVPPHEWHGADACTRWMNDLDAASKKMEITDQVVTLHKARHVDVTGDRAYVVVAADYDYKEKGTARKESNAIVALALQKGSSGWRITGWSWAQP